MFADGMHGCANARGGSDHVSHRNYQVPDACVFPHERPQWQPKGRRGVGCGIPKILRWVRWGGDKAVKGVSFRANSRRKHGKERQCQRNESSRRL